MKATFEWLVTKDNEVLLKLSNGQYRLMEAFGDMTMKDFFCSCSLSKEEKDSCEKEYEKVAEQSQTQTKGVQYELSSREHLPLISELPPNEALCYATAEDFIRFNLLDEGWPDSRGFRSAVSRRLTKISDERNCRIVIIPTHNGRNKVYGFHHLARGFLVKELMDGKYGNLEKYRPSRQAIDIQSKS